MAEHTRLSDAERAVLRLFRDGHTPKTIAAARDVRLTTIRTQFDHLYDKTGARGLLALARWADAHAECCIDVPWDRQG